MKSRQDVLEYVDNIKDSELASYLVKVIAWPTYNARVETLARKERAIDFMIKLQGADSVAWYEPARAFLHDCARDWPELASAWVEG